MVQAATSRAVEVRASALSREALRYGVKELARRAGVSTELFNTWRFEFGESGATTVFVRSGSSRRVDFPAMPAAIWADVLAGRFRVSSAYWMKPPAAGLQSAIPDFRIPFSSSERKHVGALFSHPQPDAVECAVNLPIATVLTLARFEETLPSPRDEHGRFRTTSSVAWSEGFHDRPIVDEFGLAFEQALRALMPGWAPAERQFRLMLGHDVDEIGLPFNLHSSIAHTLRRKSPASTVRDLLAPALGTETAYMRFLREIASLSLRHNLSSTIYWKYSKKGPHDTGYDSLHPKLRGAIRAFREMGIGVGIHPGYETYRRPGRFAHEVTVLTSLLDTRRVGGRQDFLRWDPSCWTLWESEGLAYDASVGFADAIGFRAGTALPYRPWLLAENREARLLEIPLTAMDSALRGYMRLGADDALLQLRHLVERCRVVGGVFHLVWHNTTMMDRGYARIYRTLLQELSGTPGYSADEHI
jgi:hypothetical protein